jgi:hypothetical protein
VRIRTFSEATGACSICGIVGKLTADHVPPKGIPGIGAIELHGLHERLLTSKGTNRSRFFQNGVVFRTLCESCNSIKLGQQFDPALIEFSKSIQRLLLSGLALPATVKVKLKPNCVARGVVGHLLAMGVDAAPFALCIGFERTFSTRFIDVLLGLSI